MWRPVHEAFELDEPFDLGIDIQVTDVLPAARVREVYASARGESGCALILAEGTHHILGDFDAAEQVRRNLATYERAKIAAAPKLGIENALAKLATVTRADPLAILHRLDGVTLWGVDDDDFEFDPESLLPDDAHEAYAAVLAERAAARDRPSVGFGLVLDQSGPTRTPDIPSAIAELSPGDARVVRLATTPARALIYLGFGGWNDCPNPDQQARIWEHWFRAHGAEPALLREDALEAIVARPVATRDALIQLACEVVAYDRDSVIEGTLPLLAMLYRNTSLHFWWD